MVGLVAVATGADVGGEEGPGGTGLAGHMVTCIEGLSHEFASVMAWATASTLYGVYFIRRIYTSETGL